MLYAANGRTTKLRIHKCGYFKPLPVNMVENAPNGNPKFGLGISPNLDLIHQH